MSLLFRGALIGFSIAAPIGPIGILCIQRTLKDNVWFGMLVGLGASIANILYGSIAGFGLTALSDYLVSHHKMIQIIGGIFLCYLGIHIIFNKYFRQKIPQVKKLPKTNVIKTVLSSCVLTMASPMTIILFLGVFAGIGIGTTHPDNIHACILLLGLFLGSMLWWIILSGLTAYFKKKLNSKILLAVNYLSAVIILTIGILAFIK